MKHKNSELINISNGLKDLLSPELKFTTKVAFAINKNYRTISELIAPYDDTRNQIIKKHCEYDKDKNPVIEDGNFKIKEGSMDAFNKEINELLDEEVECKFRMIKLSDLEKDGMTRSVADINPLMFMLQD